jgi:hypothetical protein
MKQVTGGIVCMFKGHDHVREDEIPLRNAFETMTAVQSNMPVEDIDGKSHAISYRCSRCGDFRDTPTDTNPAKPVAICAGVILYAGAILWLMATGRI